jgi:hypothetical protein
VRVGVLEWIAGIAMGAGLVALGQWGVRNPEFLRELWTSAWVPKDWTDWNVRWMPLTAQAFGVLVIVVVSLVLVFD